MQSRSKLIMVGIVLLSGVAGALSFRHNNPVPKAPPTAGLERRSSAVSETEGEGHLLGHIETEPGEPANEDRTDSQVRPVPAQASAVVDYPRTAAAQPMAATVPASPEWRAAGMPVDSPWGSSSRDQTGSGNSTLAARAPEDPFHAAGGARSGRIPYKSHRVKDGDTLSSLAQHYLGDGGRWQEVYDLNRDRLRDPDILPIGSRLKIPELGPAPVPAAVVSQRGPHTTLASDRSEAVLETPAPIGPLAVGPLVPINPGAYRNAREQARNSIYRVQPRDTLVSIARQIYGDESRFQEIYEANRQRIPDPNNLPAGAELTIP